MKKIILSYFLGITYAIFGAAFEHPLTQLTHDPTAIIETIAVSPDGAYAAYIVSEQKPDKEILQERRIRAEKERFRVRAFPPKYPSPSIYINPDSLPIRPIYVQKVMFVKIATGEQTPLFIPYTPKTLAFSPNSQKLVIGVDPTTVSGAARRMSMYIPAEDHTHYIKGLLYTDASTVRLLEVISSRNSKHVSPDVFAGGGVDMAFSYDGTSLLSTDFCAVSNGRLETVSHCNFEDASIGILYAHTRSLGPVGRCAFSSNGQHAAAQVGATVKLWDLRLAPSEHRTFTLSEPTHHCLGFSPDGSTLYASTRNPAKITASVINLLSIGEGKVYHTFELDEETDSNQKTCDGKQFEVIIPALKTLRAHQKFIAPSGCEKASTSNDEKTLLTVKDKCLYLVKSDDKMTKAKSEPAISDIVFS